MRRPLLWFCASAGLLIVLTLPAISLETDNRTLEQMPRSSPIVAGNDVLSSQITGPGQGEAGRDLDPRTADLRRRLGARPRNAPPRREGRSRDPLVQGTTIRRLGNALNIQALIRVDPESEQAENTARPAAAEDRSTPTRSSGEATVNVGGVSAFNYDLNQEVGSDLWMVIAAVVVLAYPCCSCSCDRCSCRSRRS